jgi:hypothetical protein
MTCPRCQHDNPAQAKFCPVREPALMPCLPEHVGMTSWLDPVEAE